MHHLLYPSAIKIQKSNTNRSFDFEIKSLRCQTNLVLIATEAEGTKKVVKSKRYRNTKRIRL